VAQTKGGSFFFASTMRLLTDALFAADVEPDWTFDVPEGTYLRVRNGRVESFDRFAVPSEPVLRAVSTWRSYPKGRDERDYPFATDGQWIDDDTFVPFVND
jgi:hypothetical protein